MTTLCKSLLSVGLAPVAMLLLLAVLTPLLRERAGRRDVEGPDSWEDCCPC